LFGEITDDLKKNNLLSLKTVNEAGTAVYMNVTNIDLGTTFPGANMVQGKNTLGYLRTRTFYTPERKYAYKYASITKCLTYMYSSIELRSKYNIKYIKYKNILTKIKLTL
jgi:hypothetical protein